MNYISTKIGKIFEKNFQESFSKDILVYRPPDAAQAFQIRDDSPLRFAPHSLCDFMIFNGYQLWTLELKTVSGSSISFETKPNEKKIIHLYQIESLKNFAKFKNVVSGLVIDFRSSNHTYFLNILEWDHLINSITKKSFSEKDLLLFADPTLIEKEKLKVNYRYDVVKFMDDTKIELV